MAKKTKASVKKTTAEKDNQLLNAIVEAISDKKGEDIVALDLRNIHDAASDYFVVCHATVGIQIRAIAEHVINEVKEKLNISPYHKEGFENLEWVLIDYVDIVLHVFIKPRREYYSLEELWDDATKTHYN